mmetsp:Transcript_86557/g.249761  ORF Transcript_86557/g.249761 Transcript_86557/m.249761 type:complete len:213 (+) Transcript_86557:311-949(+)
MAVNAAETMSTRRKSSCLNTCSGVYASVSNDSDKGTQTKPVRGSVRANSCNLLVCPSAESEGQSCRTNCASAQRWALNVIDVTCMTTPMMSESLLPNRWPRPCRQPPLTNNIPEAMRNNPNCSRPQNRAVHIMRSTFVELIIVRVATVMYSSALFVRPISKPCMPPIKINTPTSRHWNFGGRGRLRYTARDISPAHSPVAGWMKDVKANGYG